MSSMCCWQLQVVSWLSQELPISGLPESAWLLFGMIASFLTLSRSLIRPVSQASQQMNSIIMALAGAERIFKLIDEQSESDDGCVTLVNARYVNGVLAEIGEKQISGHGNARMKMARLPI